MDWFSFFLGVLACFAALFVVVFMIALIKAIETLKEQRATRKAIEAFEKARRESELNKTP